MKESVRIRIHRARSWLRKASAADKNADMDAQFMFLWISFNALYGTPRYQGSHTLGETADFKAFLAAIGRLAATRIERALLVVEAASPSPSRSRSGRTR